MIFPWRNVLPWPVEIKEYENAILTQEISFLEFLQDYFAKHHLRHVQKVYDDRMRRFSKGKPSPSWYIMQASWKSTS